MKLASTLEKPHTQPALGLFPAVVLPSPRDSSLPPPLCVAWKVAPSIEGDVCSAVRREEDRGGRFRSDLLTQVMRVRGKSQTGRITEQTLEGLPSPPASQLPSREPVSSGCWRVQWAPTSPFHEPDCGCGPWRWSEGPLTVSLSAPIGRVRSCALRRQVWRRPALGGRRQ